MGAYILDNASSFFGNALFSEKDSEILFVSVLTSYSFKFEHTYNVQVHGSLGQVDILEVLTRKWPTLATRHKLDKAAKR